jgi:RNA recognition motif-containing protein
MPGKNLFVGNLPYSTGEGELGDLMSRAGQVTSVRVVTDLDTGRSRGYAFVEMATPEEAARAIAELHGFNLEGRSLVVNEARSRGEATSGRPSRRPPAGRRK